MKTSILARALAVAAALPCIAPVSMEPAAAQEPEHPISQCVCVTKVEEVAIVLFGIRIGTQTTTETQCWIEAG